MTSDNAALHTLLSALLNEARKYTKKRVGERDVDRLAMQIIAHHGFELLPSDVIDAIHAIFDVHDGREVSWYPSERELTEACAVIEGFLQGTCGNVLAS